MAVSLDKWFPKIAPYLPGVPDSSIRLALAEAANDFCDRTHLWRADIEPETTVAGEELLELSSEGEIVSVLSLAVNGVSVSQIDDRMVSPENLDVLGLPSVFWVEGDFEVRMYPIPDDAYSVVGRVALRPPKTTTVVEDFLYTSYMEEIAHGALALLLSIPDKVWTNQPMATMYLGKFERGIANARVRDQRNVILRVASRPFC